MDLKHDISTDVAKLESIQFLPTEKGIKAVVIMCWPLTDGHTEALGCAYVFDKKGIPQEGLNDVAIDLIVREGQVMLHGIAYRPELIHKFKVYKEGDQGLWCQARLHFSSRHEDLLNFLTTVQKDDVRFSISPAQGELPLQS